MKGIKSADRVLVYKIECARFSFAILERAWERLRSTTSRVESHDELTEPIGIEVISDAWQVVDFAARHLNVLKTIPRINRKDERFQALDKVGGLLTKVRNYIQHVDAETHKLAGSTAYPILGAVAWSVSGGAKSMTLCLGTLPPRTSFHTVAFDREADKYLDEVLLGVGSLTLNLSRVYQASKAAADFLAEHLDSAQLLKAEEVQVGFLASDSIEAPPETAQRFLRLLVTTNE